MKREIHAGCKDSLKAVKGWGKKPQNHKIREP